jgi:lipopolysaccharide transport system ATP-binding protein
MNAAIRVENLSKRYRIGTRSKPGTRNLTDAITEGAKALWDGLTGGARRDGNDTFWALKDVSFEVKPGEVVGIIGRNGAGKSTLLKLLSRIVEPTSGSAKVRGRMGSLLEVGTGFHPELTGRENIYLNGSILGMSRQEIARKFDEIVAFSEIEHFLDTPVKRYSSGMYVRLAFAVAAHLAPEILIVDEVLAVGDIQFQKKCMGRMAEVSQEGRTILFVSHHMGSIQQLCTRAILLENGSVRLDSTPQAAITVFAGSDRACSRFVPDSVTRKEQFILQQALLVKPEDGQINYGEAIELELECFSQQTRTLAVELLIRDQMFHPIIFLPSGLRFGIDYCLSSESPRIITCRIPSLPLAEGNYHIDILLCQSGMGIVEKHESAITFQVMSSDPCGTKRSFTQQTGQGCVHVAAEYSDRLPSSALDRAEV